MQNNRLNSRGFTLIEILVVVLIVGITVGFALLAFGDFGSQRRIIMSAEQFVNYVKFVQQQAILESSTLGININQNSYQVLRFKPPKDWLVLSKKNIFRPQYFPDNAIVSLESSTKRSPQIIVNATGDMTPFKLNFGSSKEVDIAKVIGQYNGNVVLQLLKTP